MSIVRELISVILLLDGYKTYGEGSHKRLIEYLENNYKQFSEREISVINELRILRNKIAYNGFFVEYDYLERKKDIINKIIHKLGNIIRERL